MRRGLRDHQAGPRLAIAVAVGAVAYAAASAALGLALCSMLAWVAGVAAFLALTVYAAGDASPERVRARARMLDERAPVIFVIVTAAAAASLGAIGYVLRKPDGAAAIIVAIVAVAASWFLVHTMFALHYAHFYYGDDPGTPGLDERGGLLFPGREPPDYWDFVYYSFVVGMTCQVSDVQVESRGMRRLTIAHGILSFFFNTGVLALAVNIIAGAI